MKVVTPLLPASRLKDDGDARGERRGERRILELLRPPPRDEELLIRDDALEEIRSPVRTIAVVSVFGECGLNEARAEEEKCAGQCDADDVSQ